MLTLTVDPMLFPSPKGTYQYLQDQRCLSKTMQDLRRGGYLHSSRYFAVLEWQKDTQQPHYHILVDASYIPHEKLMKYWSKHRLVNAGPVIGERPPFGTAFISVTKFGSPAEAANKATNYLTKVPEGGYPAWVMQMGADKRVRRVTTSRGFGLAPAPSKAIISPFQKGRKRATYTKMKKTYQERTDKCGSRVNLFGVRQHSDGFTNEVKMERQWLATLNVDSDVIGQLPAAPGTLNISGTIAGGTIDGAIQAVREAAGHQIPILRLAPSIAEEVTRS